MQRRGASDVDDQTDPCSVMSVIIESLASLYTAYMNIKEDTFFPVRS